MTNNPLKYILSENLSQLIQTELICSLNYQHALQYGKEMMWKTTNALWEETVTLISQPSLKLDGLTFQDKGTFNKKRMASDMKNKVLRRQLQNLFTKYNAEADISHKKHIMNRFL